MDNQNQPDKKTMTLSTRLRELIDGFFVRDTPEKRMNIHRMAEIKKGQIASEFVKVLCSEGITVREAISILKDAENIIMQSRFIDKSIKNNENSNLNDI